MLGVIFFFVQRSVTYGIYCCILVVIKDYECVRRRINDVVYTDTLNDFPS